MFEDERDPAIDRRRDLLARRQPHLNVHPNHSLDVFGGQAHMRVTAIQHDPPAITWVAQCVERVEFAFELAVELQHGQLRQLCQFGK